MPTSSSGKQKEPRDTPEQTRLELARSGRSPWKKWGPYIAERQWGTVREDYSADGDAWSSLTYEEARSKAYRWGEDGIGGICDEDQLFCFTFAFWNGRDPFLKERMFGLTNPEGNHGEDVKEIYYFLDGTPSHSYLKMLYKYPQGEFPYNLLRDENHRRTRDDPEYELLDTGIFDDDRYFDIFIEYAKAGPEDILIRVTAHNRGVAPAPLHILPQFCFRNTWSWGRDPYKPSLSAGPGNGSVRIDHRLLGERWLYADGAPELLFSDNETNTRRLYDVQDARGYFKDAFHEYVVGGNHNAVNPDRSGTKGAFHYAMSVPPASSVQIRLRFTPAPTEKPFDDFDTTVATRISEADQFYDDVQNGIGNPEARRIHRQATAGLLWSKQYYYYDVAQWLTGDPGLPPPPPERLHGRNSAWGHLNNANVVSMPDTWEFPWYASWDLAFHAVAMATIDPDFAKDQLVLLTREWYMHPNGQLPAYEWDFGEVNPPVHAWATWRVYTLDRRMHGGKGDTAFLERVFHKLLLNFTWWVNRKDTEGLNIFQGGFLGLDNIGVFNRNEGLPDGSRIEQADGTSWMAMYCLNMMRIAAELSLTSPVYQDLAIKFFEHFLYIAGATANIGGKGISLWDEQDQFFYDVLRHQNGDAAPLKIRSMVGLTPLFAVETLDATLLDRLPVFKQHVEWFLEHRPDLAALISRWQVPGMGERKLLSLLRGHRMKRLLSRMLDENEFLSPHGVRALSRYHRDHPYVFDSGKAQATVQYEPGESSSALFGGNSNWRGPVWFPLNFLIIESLQKFHHYYGDEFRVECPTGSGRFATLDDVADELAARLAGIFLPGDDGTRPVFGKNSMLQADPHFKEYMLFFEYFHGDSGAGLGASHQTGWTGLVAKLLKPRRKERMP